MNARFAESLRVAPLDFLPAEYQVASEQADPAHRPSCHQDLHIGIFFDGTNNNKFRDTPHFAHSNVARLYEVYPGTPAAQTAPSLKPRVNPDGSTAPRPVFPDRPFKPPSVPAQDLGYYRKIYVPGVGTPFPDLRDGESDLDKTLGLSMASLSWARLGWALLQVCNQAHAAITRRPIESFVTAHELRKSVPAAMWDSASAWVAERLKRDEAQRLKALGRFDHAAFEARLQRFEQALSGAVAGQAGNKPALRKIRLSVFGFSRGATQARAWVNMVDGRWGAGALAGLPLQIDFLGLFDTVASVGLAHSAPGADGHFAWADGTRLAVPSSVKRCVHLVSAMEVRGSFPLDSVARDGKLPPNCKEIVYPGVHSDVGGGYPPGDQGRSMPEGPAGDAMKLSQIPLAQMYREARMAGVPLAPPAAMDRDRARNFAVAPALRQAFNEYVEATRVGSVPPTLGKGEPQFARMYPTETQPREPLLHVMRRHAGHALRWRRQVLEQPGGVAARVPLSAMSALSRHQDVEDLRGAEAELRKEIAFLQSGDPAKFDELDDKGLELLLLGTAVAGGVSRGLLPLLPAIVPMVGAGGALAIRERLRQAMHDKQRQWDSWLKHEWYDKPPPANKQHAVDRLMSEFVHDSRAWFKPLMEHDLMRLAPDDEEWFLFGGREADRRRRLQDLDAEIASSRTARNPARAAQLRQQRAALMQEGAPLIRGAREPYRLWGYLRHRTVYQTGRLVDPLHEKTQARIEREEDERMRDSVRGKAIEEEKAHHEAERRSLQEQSRRFNADPARSPSQKDLFNEATRAKMQRMERAHAKRLQDLGETLATP